MRESDEAIYSHVLRWKGRVLVRQERVHAARRAEGFKTQNNVLGYFRGKDGSLKLVLEPLSGKPGVLADITSQLAAFAFAKPAPGKEEAHRQQVQELTTQKEQLEAELARESGDFGRQRAEARLTPAELQTSIPANGALLDFFQYTRSIAAPENKGKWLSDDRLAVFVVRKDRPVKLVDLGPVEPIAATVESWRKNFGMPTGHDDPGKLLRQLVWQPIAEHVKDATTLLISPDGPLDRFPFAALPGEQPGSFLIEERAVAALPAPQLLPQLLSKPVAVDDPSLLVVGAVDFGADPGPTKLASVRARDDRSGKWGPLAGTAVEIAAIQKAFQLRYPKASITELRGGKATRATITDEAPKHRYLHFATHGFFDLPELRDALAIAPKPNGSPDSGVLSKQDIAAFNPGLLSGLVLVGANRPPAADKDDGILTALEVTQMDLEDVELATLSACETGLGESADGEGLLGLQRAFQVAGARTVVASLWQVPDRSTQVLMSRFYDNLWEKHLGKLEALRKAADLDASRRVETARLGARPGHGVPIRPGESVCEIGPPAAALLGRVCLERRLAVVERLDERRQGQRMSTGPANLDAILNRLCTTAWSKPCYDPTGQFLLTSERFRRDTSEEALREILRRLYEHARWWAPGLSIPYFVPPVRISDAIRHAGHFEIDEESYASVAVSREFVNNFDATLLILAHEACHHILFQSGLDIRANTALNEKTTDLAMFACGFGDLVRRGHSIVRNSRSQYASIHLGYLTPGDYKSALAYVLARRRAEKLPGLSSGSRASIVRRLTSKLRSPLLIFSRDAAGRRRILPQPASAAMHCCSNKCSSKRRSGENRNANPDSS